MAEKTTFYKWQNIIVPDKTSREKYRAPRLIRVISDDTFTDYYQCMDAGRKNDFMIPDCYGGPYLSILSSKKKQALRVLCGEVRNGKLDAKHKHVKEEQIDVMTDPPETCSLMFNLEAKWLEVLQDDRYFEADPKMRGWQEIKEMNYEGCYIPKNKEDADSLLDYVYSQDLSSRISLEMKDNVNGRPKLYLYGKRENVISLHPSELFNLMKIFDSIKAKFHQLMVGKKDSDLNCTGHDCTH